MKATDQKVVQYLDEARAGEQALVRVLQSQIAMTPPGSYRSGLEAHLDETRDHAARVGARLEALGHGSNPLMAIVGVAETVLGQALALGKAPFDLLRGSGGQENVLKNAKDACASETREIATYTAIERLAQSVGDDETATLAASIRADEEKMLERVMREIPKLASAVVRADVNGEHSPDISATGADDAVHDPGRARKTTTATNRTTRRTPKVAGAAPPKRQRNGATASESNVAIPDYDALRTEEITGRLADLSETELAKIESYERGHKNRTTVLSRIATLRRSASPAGENGAHPAPDANEDLRAAADAGDGAAAFTLWERLRDSDFAAAEGWLRTAAERADVRAAYPLGMLLWERRELDAAEAVLQHATDTPQGAHALGLLHWRERGNPEAAVHWLDRAAEADDPAAQRDLGSVLREHGDLQGAHHWLSRAAERDGESRRALAELVEHG
jgi:ferritin-like metal-binding protein YciE